jgi:succinoglycan biosynthesis protein ExoA
VTDPSVSVVIPTLNEADDIAGCIDALARQDYPLDAIEVIVVDGESSDATLERARREAQGVGFRAFVAKQNPRKRTSSGLNVGLAAASGELIVRIDARSRIEPHYIRTCVEVLTTRLEVGEVGGAQIAQPRSERALDVGLARAQRNRITSGFSRYRRARRSGPAEHVWMGAFRAAELRSLGGWDDATALNEDFELSQRYVKTGRTVWLDERLRSGYLARRSFSALARQHFYFGRVKGTWWARDRRPLPRQVVLLLAPPIAVAGAGLSVHVIGWRRTAACLAMALFGVEALGAGGPRGGISSRMISALGIGTYGASWWVGTVAGYLGEKAGVEHQHS